MAHVDRGQNGRFSKGNAGGPGRPPREREAEYLALTATNCPPAKWGKIVAKAAADALKGDASARNFLAKYLLPQCPETDDKSEFNNETKINQAAQEQALEKLTEDELKAIAKYHCLLTTVGSSVGTKDVPE